MSNNVERSLEETIVLLRKAKHLRLLNRAEIRDIVAERRHHEYTLLRRTATRQHFLSYAAFEHKLATKLETRAIASQMSKSRTSVLVGRSHARVNLIFSRAVKRFRGDADLWLRYVRHLLDNGSTRSAGKVLARALAFCASNENVWLAAISFHFDTCGDTRGARAIAQRALRAMPDSALVWLEYFRLELYYLARLTARRIATGSSLDGSEDEANGESHGNDATSEFMNEDAHVIGNAAHADSDKDGNPADEADVKKMTEDHMESDNEDLKNEATVADKSNKDNSGDDTIMENGPDQELSESTPIEGKSSEGTTKKQYFWHGGVPFTILKTASEKLNLTEKHRVQFFNTAAQCPCVPPKLLSMIVDHLRWKFPDCLVSQVIETRACWETKRAEFERIRAVANKAMSSKKSFGDEDVEQMRAKLTKKLDKRKVKIEELGLSMLTDLRDLSEKIAPQVKTCKTEEAVQLTLESLDTQLSMYLTEAIEKEWQSIRSLFSNEEEDTKTTTNENGTSTSMLTQLVQFLEQDEDLYSAHSVGQVCSNTVHEAVQNICFVPYRTEDHDQAVRLYLSKESESDTLCQMAGKLLSLPPVDMKTIRAVIDAQMRLWNANGGSDPSGARVQLISEIRRLFVRGASLPKAGTDLEFWLSYLQFERQFVRNAVETNSVNSKAMRTLNVELRESFIERQMLSNLSASL